MLSPTQDSLSDYTQSEQCMLNFAALQKPITFKPIFYDYTLKYQRKSKLIYLHSNEQLPKILFSDRVAQKVKYHSEQGINKKAFLLGTHFSDKETIYFDGVSYDTQEGYTRKIQSDELYSCLVHFMNANSYSPSSILQSIIHHCNETAVTYAHDSIDLIYLNHFRCMSFIQKRNNNQFQVQAFLYYPCLEIELSEIKQPNKLVETPLTKMITRQQRGSNSKSAENQKSKPLYKFGFLTLDQNKRILPLMASDPIVDQLPLIGSWIYTNDPNEEILSKPYLLWAMATEFVVARHFKQKITSNQSQNSFIFVVFQKYKTPIYFDSKLLNQSNSWKIIKTVQTIPLLNFSNTLLDFSEAQMVTINKPNEILKSITKDEQVTHRSPQLTTSPQLTSSPEWVETQPKVPPQPTPLNESSANTSLSATFIQKKCRTVNQSQVSAQSNEVEQILTQQLIQMQQEQLKMLQSQVVDLQRVLIQQSQNVYQFPGYPPQPHPAFMNPNQMHYYSPFYQRSADISSQPTPQNLSINAFPQMNNRQTLDESSNEQKQRIKTEYYNNEKIQNHISPARLSIEQTFRNLPQKLDFLTAKAPNSIKKQNEEEIEELVKTLITEESKQQKLIKNCSSPKQVSSSNFTSVQTNSPKVTFKSKYSPSEKKSIEQQQQIKKKVEPSNRKSFSSQNKENIPKLSNSIRNLQDSTQSKMPKIKFALNNSIEDSDSDAEVKMLEMKYLNKNFNK